MGKPKSVVGQRTVRGFTKAVRSQGGHVEHGGRHSKFVSPGGARVPYPSHGGGGDLGGVSFSIAKMLLAVGFVLFCCLPASLLLLAMKGGLP